MKITMYELLGLVKDGKQPKKIKYSSYIMIYDADENDYRTPEKDYYAADVKTYKYLTECIDLFTGLNDEVEIIEESKKIEKIPISMDDNSMPFVMGSQYKRLSYSEIDLMMATKINELIDEINKLKEK